MMFGRDASRHTGTFLSGPGSGGRELAEAFFAAALLKLDFVKLKNGSLELVDMLA